MVQYYESISDDIRDWALRQSVFFVASAPLRGRHVNLSPKGLPDASFAILGPNEAAYVDATGSGNETISHIRENGRITVMFCSFDKTPRILRLFCTGSVIEWSEPEFPQYLERMGGKNVTGARAIIRMDVFKVQTSCGYGVPQLALTHDPETDEVKPYLKDRETMGYWAGKKVSAGQMRAYQQECNSSSLDGLPGLHSALRDNHKSVWRAQLDGWMNRHRDELETMKTSILLLFVGMAILQWAGYI
ncbi:hypothetical protein BDV30DRAFT_228070 [Aspergillus minisclerotigenes]|uniref:Pyridoxamine 5'-phosphate oxidase N-terminal domain-containing protein n=1 Tax=Aspergillus minisclerotigenes TaxID=656917 RepID=A0A5N6IZ13_9EURO|nr:hypothetical protein BDV30DRAFT_228070 [Aspergillus minisclerotigenes]